MNEIQSPAQSARHRTIARRVRSAFSGRTLRAVTLAGVAAVTVGAAAGPSLASTSHIRPDGWAPTQECLNWSGTIQYFPGLTLTSHAVTAVLNGTLSNCNFDGTQQTFGGSVFGDLTGTATKSGATLSGNVAVTWPADAGLSPTIASISVTGLSSAYSFSGTITAGPVTGEELRGSYDAISTKKITGGSTQSILGSAPFAIYENFG